MTTATLMSATPPRPAPSPIEPQTAWRVYLVELRKSVDTRAGRVILALIVLLSLTILVWLTVKAPAPVKFSEWVQAGTLPTVLLLPIVGVLAMTSEWSQRTALTTFTLSPRRARVLLAKLAAALTLGAVLIGVVVGLSAIAVVAAGAMHGKHVSYAGGGGAIRGIFLNSGINILMGAAFGALISVTGAALVAFYVFPAIWGVLSVKVLGGSAKWLDVDAAANRIADAKLHDHAAQTVSAIAVWVLLPTVAGLIVGSRREVK